MGDPPNTSQDSAKVDEQKYRYTITHFANKAEQGATPKENIVSKPSLGRMKLWESIDPVKNNKFMDEILKTMRHTTFITLPLMFAASPAAFAAGDEGKVAAAVDAVAGDAGATAA